MNIRSIISILGGVNWLKTVYFNFHYLTLRDALHLPILIFRNTKLYSLSGSIQINIPCKTGLIMIGQHGVGIIDNKYERTIWQCEGRVIFNGKARIGSGTKLSINKGGTLIIGNNFCITGRSSIICSKNISFGNDCLLSWDILIMDTDFHRILNEKNDIVNTSKPIIIGNHVWIGCRNTILKGVIIADHVIIAAGSVLTKKIKTPGCVVGNQRSETILKDNITWRV